MFYQIRLYILDKYWTRREPGGVFAVAKSVYDSRLDSRTARAKLRPSGKPYFRALEQNLHIGYRKGKHGGKWVARRYLGDEKYAVETLGAADDFADADGDKVLTFHQAQAKARARVQAVAEETRIASLGPVVTVRDAIEEYVKARYVKERNEREAGGHGAGGAVTRGLKQDARSRLTKHVLLGAKKLAAKPLAAVVTDDLEGWRAGLRLKAPQRVVNDFKAALNAAATSQDQNCRLPLGTRSRMA